MKGKKPILSEYEQSRDDKEKRKARQLSERWKPPEQGWVTTTRLILRGVRLYLTEVGGLGAATVKPWPGRLPSDHLVDC
jgi:hypothetical protein